MFFYTNGRTGEHVCSSLLENTLYAIAFMDVQHATTFVVANDPYNNDEVTHIRELAFYFVHCVIIKLECILRPISVATNLSTRVTKLGQREVAINIQETMKNENYRINIFP